MPDPVPPPASLVASAARLEALAGYDILDTPPEADFDDIAHLAALACGAPVALVSLVAGDRQWFKARVGFPDCETDLNASVCAFVLAEPDLLVIPDLTADPRTGRNPLVTGPPFVRFYAGAPLRTPEGQVIGSLCVLDHRSRPDGLAAPQADALRRFARQVMLALELRRTVRQRDEAFREQQAVLKRLARSEEQLTLAFEASTGIGWWDWDVRADRMVANDAFARLHGVDPGAAAAGLPRDLFQLALHPDDRARIAEKTGRVLDAGGSFEDEFRLLRPDGGVSWIHARGRCYHDRDGRPQRFPGVVADITRLKLADLHQSALTELGDRLRDLATVPEVTRAAAEIVGRAVGGIRAGYGVLDGNGFVEVDPDWTAAGTASLAGTHRLSDRRDWLGPLLRGEPVVVEDVRIDPRTAADAAPLLRLGVAAMVTVPVSEQGRVVAVLFVHDRHPRVWGPEAVALLRGVADRLQAGVARLRAEAQQRLLNEELSHRLKNTLAMVQAIARQTLRGAADREAVGAFDRRLVALGRAHDVLLQQNWMTAPMRTVIEAALDLHAARVRFVLHGPDLTLGPKAALSLSMLLHELGTNAVKYGALSVERGQVLLRWSVDRAGAELALAWEETGGPPVTTPSRKGFGSRLIGLGLLGTGRADLRYEPSGLRAEFRVPLSTIADL